MMKRKYLAALLVLSLLASVLPLGAVPALADAPEGQVLYVGGVQISSIGYWTTESDGSVTAYTEGDTPTDNYIHYDTVNNTLTLHNATIKKGLDYNENIQGGTFILGSAIGVFNQSGDATLTIKLEGTNTVAASKGIHIYSNHDSGKASLTITGDRDGTLTASGSQTGILVQSNSEAASLDITNATVTATNTSTSGDGIYLQAGETSTASLTVKGGQLSATGSGEDGAGIHYYFGGGTSGSGAPRLTVSGNAIVKASNSGGDGIVTNSSEDLTIDTGSDATNGGIVFDKGSGTVYGVVTLQEDLTIGESESLDIPNGASLTIDSGATLTNEGTVTNSGTLTNNGTINNSGTLPSDIGGTVNQAPSITTGATLPAGTVGTNYSQQLAASGTETISWELASGSSLPTGLSLSVNTIAGTPTASGTFTFTVTASNVAGSDSQQFSLTINAAPAPTITTQPQNQSVTEDGTATFTVVASGSGTLTYQWQQSTDNGSNWTNITGATSASYTITDATTAMNGYQYCCVVKDSYGNSVTSSAATLTVTEQPTYQIAVDPSTLNFSTIYDDQAAPAAQMVTITNTGNQPVTLTQPTATNYVIGTLSATELAPDTTATFTVQPKADLAPGNYDENILITGSSSASASVATSFSVRERPYTPPINPPTPPSVSEETIDAINDAEPGEMVSVALEDGDTILNAEVFETLAGQDITLAISLEGGVTWSVNGTDIPADANLSDLDLGVEMNSDGIPANVVNAITGEVGTVQVTLAHDGDFGFTMTLTAPLGVENAGYWANLYHYNEAAERMDFETAVLIDEDGNAALPLSHASQYAIVIDDHSHATIDLPFSDVSAGDWFYDPVVWIYNEGLMTGTSATTFAPEATTTRAMIVSMLARLEGVTSAESAGFSDVADGDWYATAVNWAASEGIVGGFGDSSFQPNAPITREQMASILYRYAAYKGYDVSARADLSAYSDQPSVWAEDIMRWAVAEGLLNGVTDDQLQPQGQATRAQVAAILQRFLSE